MKKYILLLLAISLNSLSFLGQNIINNSSFEDKDGSEPSWVPSIHSSVEKMEVWEDDKFIAYDPVFVGEPCNYMHSPDWYKYGTDHIWLQEILPTSTTFTPTPVLANSGEGYIGMSNAELIEQEFFSSNKIKKGKNYTMSMYIRTFPQGTFSTTGGVYSWGQTWPSDGIVHLKIFLATQKIKYSTNYINCDNILGCADGDDSFDNHHSITNNIYEVKDIGIDIGNYPHGIWHKVTFTFDSPSDHTYDWIAIEQASSTDCKNVNYIGLDDISLIESCALSCYPTSGYPSPVFQNLGGSSTLPVLRITNLNNVSTAYLEIYNTLGQLIWYTPTAINGYNSGITNPVEWSGYMHVYDSGGNITGGSPTANGTYIAKLTVTNECGTFIFSNTFIKLNEGFGTYYSYTDGPKIPNPCCVADITIQNQTLNGNLLYSVGHDIVAGPSLTIANTANVALEAGHAIYILPGFQVNPGGSFSASIVDCGFRSPVENEDTDNASTVSYATDIPKDNLDKTGNTIPISELDNISIFPNPATNTINIEFNLSKDQYVNIDLFNIKGGFITTITNGKVHYKGYNILSFDISSISNGVYFIKDNINGKATQRKLIILN